MPSLRLVFHGLRTKSRLRRKFLFFFTLTGIVPLILMGVVAIYLVNRTHRVDVSTIELNLAKQQGVAIEKIIGDALQLLQIQVGFEQFSQIKLEDQRFLIEKLFEANPAFVEAAFLCLTPDECTPGYETTKSTRSGRPVTLDNKSWSPEFIAAKDGRDYIGNVYTDTQSGKKFITLAAPVKNSRGETISVLSAKMDLRSVTQSVRSVVLGNSGYLYVVDRNGNLVAQSMEKIPQGSVGEIELVRDVLAGITRTGLARNDVYRSAWQDRVIGAGYLLPTTGWAVIVEWPFLDAQRVVGTMLGQVAQFALGTLFLVILLAGVVAFQLIQPITALKECAKAIGEGRFDYRVSIRTGDEIEELGHDLNKMATNLKQLEELREIKLRAQYLTEALAKEQELSKLKDQFITIASHQLLTPLSVIGWSVEGLRALKDEKAITEGLQAIDAGRKDLLAIAHDLLTISEIGFRYKNTKRDTFELEPLVKKVVYELGKNAENRHIEISIIAKTPNTTIAGDQLVIEKAIWALVDNAIIYSNDGGRISIELDGDDTEIRFLVRDGGIGIPQDEQPFVFKEFFRAKNAISKKNVGTGLGLFIAKTIVEGHGGRIWFESEENKGSMFAFSLPRTVVVS